jgi:hypothetical protein
MREIRSSCRNVMRIGRVWNWLVVVVVVVVVVVIIRNT